MYAPRSGSRTVQTPPACGSCHLHAPARLKPPCAAPFNAPSLTPLDPCSDHARPPVQGAGWPRPLLAQQMGTSYNKYFVKLGLILSLARAFRAGPLGFLHPDPQKHVSSQPRRFSAVLENAPDTLSDSGSSRKAAPRPPRSVRPGEAGAGVPGSGAGRGALSIPGSGAFFASATTVSSEGDFSLSGVSGGE